jgi:hypothetical protein
MEDLGKATLKRLLQREKAIMASLPHELLCSE